MNQCNHVNLIKQVGPMDGGEKSKRYRCQGCGEFFIVDLDPDKISVSYEKPPQEPQPGREEGK